MSCVSWWLLQFISTPNIQHHPVTSGKHQVFTQLQGLIQRPASGGVPLLLDLRTDSRTRLVGKCRTEVQVTGHTADSPNHILEPHDVTVEPVTNEADRDMQAEHDTLASGEILVVALRKCL